MNVTQFADFFRAPPQEVDVEHIYQQWLALMPPYDVRQWLLPLPVWAHRPYDHSGNHAWEILCHDLTQAAPDRPFCIYLHVPFCASKCAFCDCYSFKLGSHQAHHIQQYTNHLCDELRLWSQQGNLHHRPVSTIHLGGGTPTFLGESALQQIVKCCRDCFNISPLTEWALESTAAALTPAMIVTMHQLGFRRLHVGVQSLQEAVRIAIRRCCSPTEVLYKITETLSLGWVVSVDLVCGLPHQNLADWVADIQTLVAAGVNGFSLYEFLVYPQNWRWADAQGLTHPDRHINNYFLFQAGAAVLEGRGYRKSLFNHWADDHDNNLYFTFPTRGEDCLAVGTIGDGVFGDYHYRHPRYAAYLRAGLPSLEGGLRRTAGETRLQPLITAVMSGHIPPHLCAGVSDDIQARWLQNRLVTRTLKGGFALTSSGSWFTGNLIHDLTN